MSKGQFSDTIYGQVVPYIDDENENYKYAILVDNEEEYIVQPNSDSARLEEYMDRWVKADVLVTETDDVFLIKLKNIEPEESGWNFTDDDNW